MRCGDSDWFLKTRRKSRRLNLEPTFFKHSLVSNQNTLWASEKYPTLSRGYHRKKGVLRSSLVKISFNTGKPGPLQQLANPTKGPPFVAQPCMMSCYHSTWHLRALLVTQHTLDCSLRPSLASGAWFRALAHSSDRRPLVIFRLLLLSSCVFSPSLLLSKQRKFFGKRTLSASDHTARQNRCSWPTSWALHRT